MPKPITYACVAKDIPLDWMRLRLIDLATLERVKDQAVEVNTEEGWYIAYDRDAPWTGIEEMPTKRVTGRFRLEYDLPTNGS